MLRRGGAAGERQEGSGEGRGVERAGGAQDGERGGEEPRRREVLLPHIRPHPHAESSEDEDRHTRRHIVDRPQVLVALHPQQRRQLEAFVGGGEQLGVGGHVTPRAAVGVAALQLHARLP